MLFRFDIAGITFGVIDVIIVALLLIFLLAGLKKGFATQVLKLSRGILSAIASFFLADPLSKILEKTPLQGLVNGKIANLIANKYPIAGTIPMSSITTQTELEKAFEQAGLGGFLSKAANAIIKIDKIDTSEEFLSGAVSGGLTSFALSAIAFAILFIVVLIVIGIISKTLKKIIDSSELIKIIDKILGGAFSVLKGAIIVCAAFLLLGMLVNWIGAVKDFVYANLMLEDPEIFTIGKYIYNSNPLLIIWNLIFG